MMNQIFFLLNVLHILENMVLKFQQKLLNIYLTHFKSSINNSTIIFDSIN